MIKKIIHYCWFGGNKKPKIIKNCIASWKKYCPDYQIKEWNETNFDIDFCRYSREAYDNKKWAFVSDVARFYILNEYGGIYLDTDVELLKTLDGFLESNFVAFENAKSINTGLIMACEKDDDLCKYMLSGYTMDRFIQTDGSFNLKNVCERVTEYFVAKGLIQEDRTQRIADYVIYDTSYFNPMNMDTGRVQLKENTVSVHRYTATWVSRSDRFRGKVYNIICRTCGKKFAENLRKIIGRK